MDEYIETNRRHWDELVPIHVNSGFYDVDAFKAGRSTLSSVEREEVGDVGGKTLLHLQCHFGMDTLAWAREGATVTGVDFSAEAIRVARGLAAELGVEARFVESDVYRLRDVLEGQFDIVFASYGVICWLPDFPRWAQIAASYVKPAGLLYLVDEHPLGSSLSDDSSPGSMRLDFPYLPGEPVRFEDDGSYADRSAKLRNSRTVQFAHSLGEIVTAIIDAGLRVEYLHEFPLCAWQRLTAMQRGDDGYWRLPADDLKVPFLFSLRARKDS